MSLSTSNNKSENESVSKELETLFAFRKGFFSFVRTQFRNCGRFCRLFMMKLLKRLPEFLRGHLQISFWLTRNYYFLFSKENI